MNKKQSLREMRRKAEREQKAEKQRQAAAILATEPAPRELATPGRKPRSLRRRRSEKLATHTRSLASPTRMARASGTTTRSLFASMLNTTSG